jgi:hypothetical protein
MHPAEEAGPPVIPPGSQKRSPNRLVHERSPYLLQHAYNPVDWYPWGDDAFTRARKENKPVFLSIGYSSCHWCHVMAHESFEDEGVAAVLNRDFVSIKVDREERPDIDSVYMGVCQQMTGRGGWPLTIVMTPEKKPFFAGTYFPKKSVAGMTGLQDILVRIAELWAGNRDELCHSADEILLMARQSQGRSGNDPDRGLLEKGFRELLLYFDTENGGFGSAPKFPAPHTIIFLLRYWQLTGEKRALAMAEQTLDAIRQGGIWDQVGFGLHRYATDARWLLPHFEKMLYDQALVVLACTEAYEATREARYRTLAEECIAYVLRNLRAPGGAFYTAEDADSPGGEGAYYTWTREEISRALGPGDAEVAFSFFTLTPLPEMNTVHGDKPGDTVAQRCVISAAGPDPVLAHRLGITEQDLDTRKEALRSRLVQAREERPGPARDTKILTDVNALFCTALARAGRVFANPGYVDATSRALQFVSHNLQDTGGHLLHQYSDREKGILAFADDYVYLVSAFIELYRATYDSAHLREAIHLNAAFLEHFHDAENGGFFTVSDTALDLPVRKKEWYDGAVPSANSVAFDNLVQIYRLTGDGSVKKAAWGCARFITGAAGQSPSAVTGFLATLTCSPFTGNIQDLVIAGDPADTGTSALLGAAQQRYLPGLFILLRPPGPAGDDVDAVVPSARQSIPRNGRATAYLCSGTACLPPVNDPQELLHQLDDGNKRTTP